MSSRPTLAAALIVKNESNNLAACLASLSWVDEIVVLDSGSTDNTEEIAKAAGARFFTNTDWPGFGKQRQIAQTHVKSDWVLWVDADERITPELKKNIEKVLAKPDENTVYAIPRLSWAFGSYIHHCGWYPGRVVRLYPTQLTQYNNALVHEKVVITEPIKIKNLTGDLLHYTYRDLEHYLIKSANYAAAWADQRKKQGKKTSITQAVAHSFSKFIKMYILKLGFLDGKQGFLLSIISAQSTFIKYTDLWIKTSTMSIDEVNKDK